MIKKKKPVNYINNDDLVKAILDWQFKCRDADQIGKEWPRQSDYIGRCIMQICNGLASRYNFANYSYRDEFVDDGIEACVNAIKSFNIEKTNKAFVYLTMVAFRAFQRRIIFERKQNAVKHKNFQHNFTLAALDGRLVDSGMQPNEYSNRVIDEYETKHMQPKAPVAKKKPKLTLDDVFKKGKKDV